MQNQSCINQVIICFSCQSGVNWNSSTLQIQFCNNKGYIALQMLSKLHFLQLFDIAMIDCNKYFKVLVFSEPFDRQIKCFNKKANMFMHDAAPDVTDTTWLVKIGWKWRLWIFILSVVFPVNKRIIRSTFEFEEVVKQLLEMRRHTFIAKTQLQQIKDLKTNLRKLCCIAGRLFRKRWY